MKILSLAAILLSASLCGAQSWSSVLKDSPKRDDAFTRSFTVILSAAGSDFSSLPKKLVTHTYTDTTWLVDYKLPGAGEATLTKSNGASTLTESFSFSNDSGLDQVLQKIKASLPDDYVYSLDYDADSHTYDYTFEVNPKSRTRHAGYPNYFHLTGDLGTVFIFMGRSPLQLTK